MLRIVLLCIVTAIAYGVLHNQITARLCIEYFTIAHPPLIDTDDPTVLGLGWGVVATWWIGLILGILLGFSARVGGRPKRAVAALVTPLLWLVAITASAALLGGIAGWAAARGGIITLAGRLSRDIPVHHHVSFLAVAWAHTASYMVGIIGGLVVVVATWSSRRPTS